MPDEPREPDDRSELTEWCDPGRWTKGKLCADCKHVECPYQGKEE